MFGNIDQRFLGDTKQDKVRVTGNAGNGLLSLYDNRNSRLLCEYFAVMPQGCDEAKVLQHRWAKTMDKVPDLGQYIPQTVRRIKQTSSDWGID
jgi:hypothetical protein